MRRVFIFGAGYSGAAIAGELLPNAESVIGTRRSAEKADALRRIGVQPLVYAGDGFEAETISVLADVTEIVVSIPPDGERDPVLTDLQMLGQEAMPNLRWIGYLSTVGVYGDHGCAWVDEESECRPISQRSRRRLEAERNWTAFGKANDVPVAILRLSGIYGPGRNALCNISAGTAKRIVKPGQVFNRIHVEDIAGAVSHLMGDRAGGIYNLTDDEPSPPQDVVAHAARLMGVEPPPEVPFEDAALSPMARSFYSECKRVSNARLKASGYSLRQPNYRQAVALMWRSGEWRGGSDAADMV